MIDYRLQEYWYTVTQYRNAPIQHKTGIFNGRIPNTIKHSENPLTKKLLSAFLNVEANKPKVNSA